MPRVQFRRYELKPDSMDDFLVWWHQIVPIRERTGFALLCAFALHEQNEFVSAWRYDGDLAELERRYYGDPERRRLAGESRTWAVAHAVRTTGKPADSAEVTALVGEHPGFTARVHITTAELAHPGRLTL
ncbi:NIPSNAP family protein [Amycolatopsis sp. GM8]|uniref:NIPSNAP family protein n=1 Tax=Amycolatopsis sp. GM8 TaxID=2896530 RepID=UPI001F20269C|nr:NIPSNAP family protein [Amycolatopsis sp. GM8]